MKIIEAQKIFASDPRHQRAPHAPEYEKGSAFTQGEYRPIDQGVVPIQDMGFIHADAAYDVVSASAGYIFRMEDHINRFNASCAKFALENPYSDEETIEILTNLVKLTGVKDAYIWWAVTRGAMDAADRSSMKFDHQFYAFVTPYSFILDDETRVRGGNLQISEAFIRIAPKAVDPTAKNFHWMDMKLSLFEALMQGADWSVLTDADGHLTESPGSNIFLIKDGVIKTPATGCLEGITRQTVFDLAEELGVPWEATTLTAEELKDADEAFLTSTAGGIMPASHVNGQPLGGKNGPGDLSTQLHNLYWEKRWDGWLGEAIAY
jgi:branched-chain amino acid aminotransferase